MSLHTHTHNGIFSSHRKEEESPAICDNVDRPWGHYAKWGKSGREKQILYDNPCMESEKAQLIETERVEWWLVAPEGTGKMGRYWSKDKTFNYKMNKFWGSNIQNDYG